MTNLKTPYRQKKEAQDLEIMNRLESLTMDPNNQRMAVLDLIREEFGIASYSAIYAAVRRAKSRING